MDINQIPKRGVDQFVISRDGYQVNIAFRFGNETLGIVLNPVGAKVLLGALKEQVEALEKSLGEIDISGSPKMIPSPMQSRK